MNNLSQITNRISSQPFVVSQCVIERNGSYLLVEEGKKWNLPGGWVELDEKPADAAKRELMEETNLKLKMSEFLGVWSLIKQRQNKTLHAVKLIFLAHVESNVNIESTIPHRWITMAEISELTGKVWDDDIIEIIKCANDKLTYPLTAASKFLEVNQIT